MMQFAKDYSHSLSETTKSLLPGSLTSREELSQAFLSLFFLPLEIAHLRRDIGNFKQFDLEPMHEA